MKTSLGLTLAGLVACLSLCGCFKEKQDFTVNPDGSGKVTFEFSKPQDAPAGNDLAAKKEQARELAAKIVSGSEGVTAWKNVTFSADKDGWNTVKGTAYFKDISKFKIGADDSSIRWQSVAGGAVQLELVIWGLQPTPKEPPKLAEEEIKREIADARKKFQATSDKDTEAFKDLRMEWNFTLPGPVEKCVNFQTVANKPNTVRVLLEGEKYLDAFKTLYNDDAYLRAMIVAGKTPDNPDPEVLNEKLFGTKRPITVSFKPGDKPLFDWAAESEAAKKAMPEMQKGLEAPAPATTAK